MAKLFINKDIVADSDKMENWYFTGVDGMSFSDVQDFISWIPLDDPRIDIELHSCGGDVAEGYAIYDALRATGKEISATVVGRCASMATVILLAAPIERRKMYPHAKILIHSPFCPGIEGSVDIQSLEALKSGLEAEREKMLSLYVERCGVDRSLLEEQMAKETWFGGEVAKQLGFVSEVIMPKSAKVSTKTIIMNKEKEVTVKKPLFERILAKAGYAKIEDVPAVALELTTAGGDTLTVEREEGDPQVGDPASPDGEHVMPDGKTIVVTDGVITEIREAENGGDDTAALEARIAELEQQVSDLTANAKTEDDIKILDAVAKAGGIDKLTKAAASKYVPAGRTPQTSGKKPEVKHESKIDKKLAAIREKNKQRFNK
jgi:ATP-dependent Clp protease protease subunit